MQKHVLAVLSLLALCGVLSTSAWASPVLTDEGKVVSDGTKIAGTNTEPIRFTAGEITLTCTESTLTGEVKEIVGASNKVTITSVTYTGYSGGRCTSNNLGEVTITTEVPKIDWCISSSSSDAVSLQAGACGSAPVVLKFTLDTSIGITCVYFRPSTKPITGTYATGNDVLAFGSGAASEYTSTSFGCPGNGSFDVGYTLEAYGTSTPITIS